MPTAQPDSTHSAPQKIAAVEPRLELQAFSYDERRNILPALATALDASGGWVLERKALSVTQTLVRFEIQLRSVLDLYSALIGAGLELTRGSHLSLTGLCTLRKHHRRHRERFRVIEVHMEVSFLEELNLSAALIPGAASA